MRKARLLHGSRLVALNAQLSYKQWVLSKDLDRLSNAFTKELLLNSSKHCRKM